MTLSKNGLLVDGSPQQYAVQFLWTFFDARGQWPSRKALLLTLDNAGLKMDAIERASGLIVDSGDEVRPTFTTLVSLPAVREMLDPVPALFRHAARAFVEQALVVPENFLPSVHYRDIRAYWSNAAQAKKALHILRGPGGFFQGGHSSGTDPDDFSFSVTIDSLRYEHVGTLDEVLELPRYPVIRNVGLDPSANHLEMLRRIYRESKADQAWPRALAFGIASRDIGYIPQLVNELRPSYVKAEYSPSQHHMLVLTERALPLVDLSGEDQSLFAAAIRSIVELWRAREDNGDILLTEVAASLNVLPERLGPIVAFLDSAEWCHAAHRTDWGHSGLVIVPGEADLVLRNKDVTSFAEYLERWEDERVRKLPEIWLGPAQALVEKGELATRTLVQQPRASSVELEPAEAAEATSGVSPRQPGLGGLAHFLHASGYKQAERSPLDEQNSLSDADIRIGLLRLFAELPEDGSRPLNRTSMLGHPTQPGSLEHSLTRVFSVEERGRASRILRQLEDAGLLIPTMRDIVAPADWLMITSTGRDALQNESERGDAEANARDAEFDAFLCHASEDKAAVVAPFAALMKESGLKPWWDAGQIRWGDSLVGKIEYGLSRSRFVIVFVSSAFLNKRWPEKELRGALTLEIGGVKKVLPVVLGLEHDALARSHPFIAEKLYRSIQPYDPAREVAAEELRKLVDELKAVLRAPAA
jgi:hypothetical protein